MTGWQSGEGGEGNHGSELRSPLCSLCPHALAVQELLRSRTCLRLFLKTQDSIFEHRTQQGHFGLIVGREDLRGCRTVLRVQRQPRASHYLFLPVRKPTDKPIGKVALEEFVLIL